MSAVARPRPMAAAPLGIYLAEINEVSLLTREEEAELAARISEGDRDARDRMARANLRLVVRIARGYLGKGLALDDLIAEGNLGLMRAVEGFDAGAGVRFSTYASYWIKQSIRSAVMRTGRPIRLPAHMVKLLAKWRRASRALADQLGRDPAPEEVGRALGLSKKRLAMATQALEVAKLMAKTEGPEGDEPWQPLDLLVDGARRTAEERAIDAEERGRVDAVLGELGERAARVVGMRFGLDTGRPMTLREVGEELGLTRERVRQIEADAMRQIEAML
jgi:RNA polymerase primary sigma factor